MAKRKYEMNTCEYRALKTKIVDLKRQLKEAEKKFANAVVISTYEAGKKSSNLRTNMVGTLDEDKMKVLFGRNYKNIVYYNCDTGVWSADSYLGHEIENLRYHTANVKAFKKAVEGEYAKLEMAACAIMAVKKGQFPDVAHQILIRNPQFNARGTGAVGMVVCRDRQTGQLIKIPNRWIGVAGFRSKTELIQQVMSRFAVQGARDYFFRHRIMENCK